MAFWPFDFPRRAPTKTWMMLTFILFVGIAMVVVAVYGSVVLRRQFRAEAYARLLNETKHILADLEREHTGDDFDDDVARLSRITARRVTVVMEGRLVSDWQEGHVVENSVLADHAAARKAMRSGQGYEELSDGLTGRKTLFVALASRRIDMIVQVGHVNPPLFEVLERTQFTLFLGMGLALMLTLFGSWIASQQISVPLHTLTTSAQRINAGEFDEAIAVRSRAAEFQDLARSLDAMAEHFREDIKQLQRLIRIQNEFLGNVSHEVRNPIFAIGGYLEALGSQGLSERQRQRYVQKGAANLDRLNILFSDLVEIARLEYREDILHREVFDFQKLVMEVAETARMKAEEKDLLLDVKNPAFSVEADRSRMAQVLTNLLENAIAYTDKGFIKCRLKKEGKMVRVTISDSGRGIGEEHLERIFDRFYRVDKARSRTHGGTGLGLSIVKQILHAHGASIQVYSEEGAGTMFWFELPFRPGSLSTKGVRTEADNV